MPCEKNDQILTDAALGVLSPAARETLAAHLVACEGCSAELRRLRELFAAIDRGVAASVADGPSANLAARVRVKLNEQPPPASAWVSSWMPVAAGALALLLLGALWIVRPGHNRQPPVLQSDAANSSSMPAIARGSAQPQPAPSNANGAASIRAARRAPEGRAKVSSGRPAQVLVIPDEAKAVQELYTGLRRMGRIDTAIADSGSPAIVEQKIEPQVIAPLDDGTKNSLPGS